MAAVMLCHGEADSIGRAVAEAMSRKLSKRELFAAMAVQGLSAAPHDTGMTSRNGQMPVTRYEAQAFIAEWAVDMADALLRALEQPPVSNSEHDNG